MADLSKVQQIVDDIAAIKIQGATNIAKSAFHILVEELKRQKFSTAVEVREFLFPAMQMLEKARPTEPMMFNGMAYITSEVASLGDEADVASLRQKAEEAAQHYFDLIISTAQQAIDNGVGILKYGDSVLTHCHSSSAIKTIIANKAGGKDFLVYNTETRPLYQGRKTAKDFLDAGMKITMIVDASAPFILDKDDPFGLDIHAVIIGCDAIKLDGSIINKVGSYSISAAAFDNTIPVYIAGNLLKLDVHDDIHIETRAGEEVWPDKPEGLEIINFAFDQIPPRFVTGIITEFGILKPHELEPALKKHYPWMLETASRGERH